MALRRDIPRKRLMRHFTGDHFVQPADPIWAPLGEGERVFLSRCGSRATFLISKHQLTLYRNQGLMPKLPDLLTAQMRASQQRLDPPLHVEFSCRGYRFP